ncbi:hypothetical protein AGOR_G00156990 [Albula goreensis]|uniref:Uncharacterized protein n=1 Tax=Albula goreensis TaxID=1534307 RepID=A0A8T3D7Y7_9TELE|nr:hypothetical protein AGOR_G00156990 [Albula goreensis]
MLDLSSLYNSEEKLNLSEAHRDTDISYVQNHVQYQQANLDSTGEWANSTKPVWPSGPGTAASRVPRHAAERPGGCLPSLEFQLCNGDTNGGWRLPVGGGCSSKSSHAVPLLHGGGAETIYIRGGLRFDQQGEHPTNPRKVYNQGPAPGDDTRETTVPNTEAETDQHHRFLPGKAKSSTHAPEIRAVKTDGSVTVPKYHSNTTASLRNLNPAQTVMFTFTRRTCNYLSLYI